MGVRIGVDTGGTFTDVVLYQRETGNVYMTKTPSTPPNFDRGVLNGIDKILEMTDTDPANVTFLSHGTTVGTNAVLEEEIPNLGLITNEGLRDVLEIGDQTRPDLYDLQTEKPPSLVPRYLRKGVTGRLDAAGNVVDPLDEERARSAIDDLASENIESIVVSFLFSYLNDEHEQRVGELIESHESNIDYALASEIHPEIREYNRTITTILNEAIKTKVEDYFSRLADGITERRIDAPLNIIHSGGGIFTATQAAKRAVRTVTSGPAAGAVAAHKTSQREGFDNAIGMDMGGTSADVSIIRDGEIVRTTEGEINNLPINTPMIDIETVGAGGGSIAWIDDGGALRVGPESSGADPGPICYGRGGTEPTITDANLLLGRLNSDRFLDEMTLEVERTREIFEEEIAKPLGMSVEEAALSVVEVANASIARKIHTVTVERGDDPSSFTLVGFGGAGPLQAPAVADSMDIESIVIPRNPGVFSARGILIADVRIDESYSYRGDELEFDTLATQFEELSASLADRFREQGFDPEDATLKRSVDLRYTGQSYELTVPVAGTEITDETITDCKRSFHEKHERLYGHAKKDEQIDAVTVRASGVIETTPLEDTPARDDADARVEQRDVYFANDGFVPTDIYERTRLEPGQLIDGPAILEENGSTSIVPPDATCEVSKHGNVVIALSQE